MKQLILTFFAIILCYSLFFNDDTKYPAVDEINYIYEDSSVPGFYFVPDTLNSFALYNMGTKQTTVSRYFYIPEYGQVK